MWRQRLDNQGDGLLEHLQQWWWKAKKLFLAPQKSYLELQQWSYSQIYNFGQIWLRIWNQWKTFIYKKRKKRKKKVKGNLRTGMSINFNFQNGNKLQRVWKKRKRKKTCMTSNQSINLVQNYLYILTNNWSIIIGMKSILEK